jgi:hypothetical protein
MDLDELAIHNTSEDVTQDLICGCEDPGAVRTPPPTPARVECKGFATWPNKDGNADCGQCKHLVSLGTFVSCDAYCASFGQSCWYAGVNDYSPAAEHGCQAVEDVSCGENMAVFEGNAGQNNMICGCRYIPPDAVDEPQYTWTATTTTSMWYDCDVGPWPSTKSNWCCEEEQKGCGTYTCKHGPWPPKKKEWCCTNLQQGCQEDDYYDCSQGPWPAKKRDWCCTNQGVNCPQRPKYSCDSGPWPATKRAWCCVMHKKGCDSDAGLGVQNV